MCGIVGFAGTTEAAPILLDGLERLEYRGYDSAGVAVLSEERGLQMKKSKGRLKVLRELTDDGRRGQILDPAHVDIRVMLHSSVLTLTPSAARARRTCEGFSNRMARIPTASAPATFFGTSSINTHSSRFSPYRSSRHS